MESQIHPALREAINSIKTTGGKQHDANVLARSLGKKVSPYLGAIRTGSSNVKAAEEIEKIITDLH